MEIITAVKTLTRLAIMAIVALCIVSAYNVPAWCDSMERDAASRCVEMRIGK